MSDLKEENLQGVISKTPVSILNEYMQKDGSSAVFTISEYQTQDNSKLFKCDVTAKNQSVSASGKSKMEAKHKAAEMLLNTFQGFSKEEKFDVDMSKNNYVGTLHEHCQRNLKIFPKYDVVEVEGSLLKTFQATCTVDGLSITGEGHNKKIAKQMASQQMLLKLQSQNLSDRTKSQVTQTPKATAGGKSKVVRFADDQHVEIRSNGLPLSIKSADHCNSPTSSEVTDSDLKKLINSLGDANGFKKNTKKKSWNCMEDDGESGDEKREPCYLCKYALRELSSLSLKETSAVDIQESLRRKQIPVWNALNVFKDKEDPFFEQLENVGDLLDLVMDQLDFSYYLEFPRSNRRNDSVCYVKVKDLQCASFMGFAGTPQASFKKAAMNTLRSLLSFLTKHHYHEFFTSDDSRHKNKY